MRPNHHARPFPMGQHRCAQFMRQGIQPFYPLPLVVQRDPVEGDRHAPARSAGRGVVGHGPSLGAGDAAQELRDRFRSGGGDVALVFGNETSGLSNAEVALCQRWTTIPTAPDYSSLNLAQAVQILCYELRRSAVAPGLPPEISGAGVPATHEEMEGLLASIEHAALASGFLDPCRPGRLMLRLRRLLGRAVPEREEVSLLRGLVAALLVKWGG